MLPAVRLMPLLNVPEPFSDRDWLFEPKWDGFRALARIEGHRCDLVSRRGNAFKSWPQLAEEIAHIVRCHEAVLDGELVCLRPDGRSDFYSLLFRRDWPHYLSFDLLWLDGIDYRDKPLSDRKRTLRRILPRIESRVRYVEGIRGRGVDFYRAACALDLEGVVGKWLGGRYQEGGHTSWLKVRNPSYTQWEGRRELFEEGRDRQTRRLRWVRPVLRLV